MTEQKILITGDFSIPAGIPTGNVVHLREPKNNTDIAALLPGITHYIVGGPEYVDAELMDAAPDLRHIVVMGTGTNSFANLKDAQEKNIVVDNTPGINADAVAEFALGAVISNLANAYHSRDDLLFGGWTQKPHKTLSESSIGIIGAGDIGSKVARKIRAISNASISYFSRSRKAALENEINAQFKPLPDLVSTADAVILCVTYTPETHHLLNDKTLGMAKEGQILLCFSNPKVVDPVALRQGLIDQRPRRAFFDSYYNEWMYNQGLAGDQYGLLSLGSDKFVATSHIAAQAETVIAAIVTEAFRIIDMRRDSLMPGRGRATNMQIPKLDLG
ncbi:MAG: NAD(P)-dependent oxidoreductase [Alphaproteobacteria bacterium]